MSLARRGGALPRCPGGRGGMATRAPGLRGAADPAQRHPQASIARAHGATRRAVRPRANRSPAPAQDREAQQAQRTSRRAVASACKTQREHWASEHAPGLAAVRGICRRRARRADPSQRAQRVDGRLHAHHARQRRRRVGELDNPSAGTTPVLRIRWNRTPTCASPSSTCAAVAGRTMHPPSRRHALRVAAPVGAMQVGRGLRIATTDAALEVLRAWRACSTSAGAVAYVVEGRARAGGRGLPDRSPGTRDATSSACAAASRPTAARNWSRWPRMRRRLSRVPYSPSTASAVRAPVAVVTAPTLRADGSVLTRPASMPHRACCCNCCEADAPRVPDRPTPADDQPHCGCFGSRSRASHWWMMWRGVVLHGLLTAAVRAALQRPLASRWTRPRPAPARRCWRAASASLADGGDRHPPAGRHRRGNRKRLFAALRRRPEVLLWDNVREPLGCAALVSF